MGSLSFSKPRTLVESDVVDGFSCGVGLTDAWVAVHARRARALGAAVVYATFCQEALAGFYSLSSQSITRREVRGWLSRNAPQQIPVILLGMLGVDTRYQGIGLGHDLLLDAVRRARAVSEQIGARAIVVDPYDESAARFYAHYGFGDIPGTRRMFAKLI